MKTSNDLKELSLKVALKAIPTIAVVFCLGVPVAMAGATNRGDNTTATPGDNSSTVTTPTDPNAREDNIRKGTTNSNTNSNSNSNSNSKYHKKSKRSNSNSGNSSNSNTDSYGNSGTGSTGSGSSSTGTGSSGSSSGSSGSSGQ